VALPQTVERLAIPVTAARAWRPVPREVADIICLDSPSRDTGPRMHARIAFILIRSQALIRVESRRSIVIDKKCLLIVPALQLYELQAVEDAANSVITVLVRESQLEDAVEQLPALLDAPDLLHWMTLVGREERAVGSRDRTTALPLLIAHCVAESVPLPHGRAKGWIASLSPLRDYMRAHLHESVPMATLMKIRRLTESHCIRAFHQQFGLPPHAYHLQLRLAAACELLTQGLHVATAAYDCGFADQSHLSRKFKEAYGLSPTAWAHSVGRG
jgi:AraC-like DNA-binding protein